MLHRLYRGGFFVGRQSLQNPKALQGRNFEKASQSFCSRFAMPKHIDWEPIYKHWKKTGESSQAIAERFGVSKRAVDERLPKWREMEVPPAKVVELQQRVAGTTAPVRPRRRRDFDEIEVVDGAIASVAAAMETAEASTGLGSLASGLVRLLEYRRKASPPTAAELAGQLLEIGVSPAEFTQELKRLWQARA